MKTVHYNCLCTHAHTQSSMNP